MSAEEIIFGILTEHRWMPDGRCSCHDYTYRNPESRLDHVATALVAAIRSMPAEQKAEVVDGEVEEGVAYHDVIGCPERFHPPGSSTGWQCPHPFVEGDLARVVTPWLPLGVSEVDP